jgi:ABC-2 type transport system permease protein
MTAAFWAELRKLRRPRVLFGIGGLMVALGVLATVLAFATAKSTPQAFNADRPGAIELGLKQLAQANGATRGFAIGSGFGGVVVLVLFAVSVAGEFSGGTIRNLLLLEPRRLRLLAGKVAALLVFVALGFVVAEAVSIASAYALAAIRGVPTHEWLTGSGVSSSMSVLGDAVLAGAGWALLGAAVGVIVRSVPAALAVALVWVMPFENIVYRAWSGAAHWFPGLLLQGLGAGTGGSLGWSRTAVTLAVYLMVLSAVAAASFVRRDVTA